MELLKYIEDSKKVRCHYTCMEDGSNMCCHNCKYAKDCFHVCGNIKGFNVLCKNRIGSIMR